MSEPSYRYNFLPIPSWVTDIFTTPATSATQEPVIHDHEFNCECHDCCCANEMGCECKTE